MAFSNIKGGLEEIDEWFTTSQVILIPKNELSKTDRLFA